MTEAESEDGWRDHAGLQGQGVQAQSFARRQLAEWQSRARTPQTRAEIRRWSRWEAVSFWLLMAGVFFIVVAAPVFGLTFGIWGAFDDRVPSWMWGVFGSAGICCILLLTGGILGTHANDRRLTALYADGQVSVGRLEEVITHPGGGEEQTTYEFLITAELPVSEQHASTILRRRLYWGEDDSWGAGPQRRIGKPIRFRHNTFEPDDLYDVRFDGWPHADREKPRMGPMQ